MIEGDKMADLTCGTGGSTGYEIVTRINENTNGIVGTKDDIAENRNNIVKNEGQIVALKAYDPRAAMRLNSAVDVDISDDPTPILLPVFDTIITERGGFDANTGMYRLTNNTGYDIEVTVSIGINIKFSSTEKLDVWVYHNDQPYTNSEFTVRGEGDTKPVAIFWQSVFDMANGDHIDIRGKNSSSGTYTATFERTHFRIDSTIQDVLAAQ